MTILSGNQTQLVINVIIEFIFGVAYLQKRILSQWLGLEGTLVSLGITWLWSHWDATMSIETKRLTAECEQTIVRRCAKCATRPGLTEDGVDRTTLVEVYLFCWHLQQPYFNCSNWVIEVVWPEYCQWQFALCEWQESANGAHLIDGLTDGKNSPN